ncbi:MAG: deoxyuridine 5'-triphosphate nucleotidohydrolase [Candidatus Micrarchaeia archaeon]
MPVLSDIEIKKLIEQSSLIDRMVNKGVQLQPAGVDLTLSEIFEFKEAGCLDFTNKERVLPKCKKLKIYDEVKLKSGAYKVVYNEIIRVPPDCIGLAFPRSSLLRCGAFMHCAVWDPGYEGRSESLLIVSNKHGIKLKRNARLAQLIFLKLSAKPKAKYSGKYLKENIKSIL